MWRHSVLKGVKVQLCLRTQHGVTCSCQWLVRSLMTKTSDPFDPSASEVIDVRAPAEYQVDHIPGALNFPVLTDEQRAHVGEVYSKDSFEARKLGAGLVSGNISAHISNYFVEKPAHYRPMLYCWRGGQRSQSLAIVLSQTGFDVLQLEGGYRTYRRKVISDLQCLPDQFNYVVLTGLTGTGKTLLLQTLQQHGAQVLDLEALARHKGSLLGLWHGDTQPSQKMWESQLRHSLASFDPARPVWVESESSRVGNLTIPPGLFHKMCKASRLEVFLPLDQRVKHILEDYPHWTEDVPALKSALLPLKRTRGEKAVEGWFRLADEGRWDEFVQQLLVQHYDLTYNVSQKKNEWSTRKRTVHLRDLSEKSRTDFVENVMDSCEIGLATEANTSV